MDRRHQPKRHAREQRTCQREHQHGKVDANLIGARNARRRQHRQRARRPISQQQAAGGADQAERRALGEHLPHEPPAIGADRGSQRQLAKTAGTSSEQQIGDVRAGDEQDEAHRSRKEQERRPRVAHHRLEQRRNNHALVGVVGRVLLLEPRGDGRPSRPWPARATRSPSAVRRRE